MSKVLMKGNEAIARAAVLAGVDAFFGYPITPQNEIPEYLSKLLEEEGRVFVQAESEVAAINMVYGAAGAGARVMTSSSSVGIALKQEGISYIAGSELPCVIVSVMRGGPGLGGIQPSQADYYQATRGGGNGDYHVIVFAPESIQETVDIMKESFDIADTYRNPVMILVDGLIGQMMETVDMDNPDYVIVAYGTTARIARSALEILHDKGIKVGLIRPISVWPYPKKAFDQIPKSVKGILVAEMSLGQMLDDVLIANKGRLPVAFFGRTGGVVPEPEEIADAIIHFEDKVVES
ncbi:MAG: 3-methyl-2-oxobutanoate dehydrogenase subunit VorB [Tenericutes bacterium HGW-Tenericutes-7]|nr:MAG: 3-methyl-2-oxobutanoate dehydrogenase subunit VorB [Tenericutes bacterium HGW-Tenericutes-7]